MSETSAAARILVVEDNPNNRRLMVSLLQANRFEVRTANDGEDGVAAAFEYQPALILMDLQMPRLDGYGALKALRQDERTSAIPVIAVSGNATPADRSKALEAGFNTFVAKPFSIDQLLEEIRSTLAA